MPRLGGGPPSQNCGTGAPRGSRALRLALLIAAPMVCLSGAALAQEGATPQPSEPAATSTAPSSSEPPPLSSTSAPAPVPPAPPATPVNANPAAAAEAPARLAPRAEKPAAPPAPASAKKPPAATDHEKVVGHFGIGFIGVSELPLAVAEPVGTKDQPGLSPNDRLVLRAVAAPTLGARIWISKRIGVDTGLGFSYTGGSTSSELGETTADVDKQSVIAFLVHAGVPIVLADLRHMSLMIVPEATFGMARSNVAPLFEENAPPEAELSGARLDIGVRAGAEIHFGFMGLPNLALEAGIGLVFTTEWASATVGEQSVSDVATRFTTTSFSDPWDIFNGVGNVSARYYF